MAKKMGAPKRFDHLLKIRMTTVQRRRLNEICKRYRIGEAAAMRMLIDQTASGERAGT